MAIVGACMAIYRRYILKPSRLETKPDNQLIFVWGLFLLVTGFLAKGYRMAAVGVAVPPDWYHVGAGQLSFFTSHAHPAQHPAQ